MAVTSTAFAQNVTISGRIDQGTTSTKETDSSNGNVLKSSTLAGANGSKTGSRITFAGTEDLGGGLTAFFNIESGLNNSVIGNRNLFVGARGSFGSVQLGRYLNTFSAIRDSHYSIAGGAGGAFLNRHLNVAGAASDAGAFLAGGQTAAVLPQNFVRRFTLSDGKTIQQIENAAASGIHFNNLLALAGNTRLAAENAVLTAAGATTAADDGGVIAALSSDINLDITPNHGSTAGALVVALTAAQKEYFASLTGVTVATSETDQAYLGRVQTAATNIIATQQDAAARLASLRADNAARAGELRALLANGIPNRSSNTLAYTTPNFNGLTATFGFSDSDLEDDDKRVTGKTQAKTQGQSISLAYSAGPLAARLTTGTGKVTTETKGRNASAFVGSGSARPESRAKTSDTAMMVSYDFGMAQTYIMNNRTKSTLEQFRGVAATGTNLKTNATEIGAKMPMGAFEPFVTIGRGDITSTAGGVQVSKTKTSAHQLGLNYSLSKRTVIYASTGQEKYKDTGTTSKVTGYTAGLVHNF